MSELLDILLIRPEYSLNFMRAVRQVAEDVYQQARHAIVPYDAFKLIQINIVINLILRILHITSDKVLQHWIVKDVLLIGAEFVILFIE